MLKGKKSKKFLLEVDHVKNQIKEASHVKNKSNANVKKEIRKVFYFYGRK